MSHNRKAARKNRTVRMESLERREMMSATPWELTIQTEDQKTSSLVSTAVAGVSQPTVAVSQSNGFRPGDLDTTFGTGGKVFTNVSGTEWAEAVAIQNDGKIVVAGRGSDDFIVTRYLTNGKLDTSFGSSGSTHVNLAGVDTARDVLIQPDGKILIVGGAGGLTEMHQGTPLRRFVENDLGLVRLTSNGKLDTSFGTGGKVTTNISGTDWAEEVALQDDGKIIVVGNSSNDFVVARYLGNGKLDTSFGSSGTTTVNFAGIDSARDVVIQPDGKLLVVGSANNESDLGLMRLQSNGKLDTSFGTGGKVTTSISGTDWAEAVALQDDGKIVVVGNGGDNFVVARYLATGKPDTSFGNSGTTSVNFGAVDTARDVVIQPDGKIVVVGGVNGRTFFDRNGFVENNIGVMRLNSNGKLDMSFGQSGKITTITPGTGWGEAVALQKDGKIVVVGGAYNDLAVIRYHGDPPSVPGRDTTLNIQAKGATNIKEGNAGYKTAHLFTISRSGNTNLETTVSFQVAGSGSKPANAADFVGGKLPSGSVTFATGETSKDITIFVAGDAIVEGNEGFTVNLLNPTAGVKIGTSSVNASIVNDDDELPPTQTTLAISSDGAAEKQEGAAGATTTYTFRVTRSGDTKGETTVNYAVTGSGSNQAGDDDFVGGKRPSGTLNFAAGETTKDFKINVAGDAAVEQDEEFTVTLSNPSGSASFATDSATGTIQNDDKGPIPPEDTVPPNDPSITPPPPWYEVTYNQQGNPSRVEIYGTDKVDRVIVSYKNGGLRIQRDEQAYWFEHASQIEQIVFGGGAGNDRFENQTSIASRVYGGQGNDTLIGGGGGDRLDGGDGHDKLYGQQGADYLIGGSGNDLMEGGGGSDKLYGQDGNDTLRGQRGNDLVIGGAGNDALSGGDGNDRVEGGLGSDKLWGDDGNDVLFGQDGDDTVYGGQGNDSLRGGTGNDLMEGGSGHDKLYGQDGNDTLRGQRGNDLVIGGAGNDALSGGDENDRVEGGLGNDKLWGDDGNDVLFGQDGDDTVYGGQGNDSLRGGTGNDLMEGGSGHDKLYGQDGNDTLRGQRGNDLVIGGAGNDALSGGDGNDRVEGGLGSDTLWGDDGEDVLLGQQGNDVLYGGNSKDTLKGGTGNDRLEGGYGHDHLEGDDGDDVLVGGYGNDTMYGNRGRDKFFAQFGNDSIYGGHGNDVFYNAKKTEIKQN